MTTDLKCRCGSRQSQHCPDCGSCQPWGGPTSHDLACDHVMDCEGCEVCG